MNRAHSIRRTILGVTLWLQFSLLGWQSLGVAGDVDLSFDPGSGVNGTVNALVIQPDGKVIIGGKFTTVRGLARTNLARLDPDGGADSSFAPEPQPYPVYSLVLQPDGKVLVGSEQAILCLKRLNSNGSADANFSTQTPMPRFSPLNHISHPELPP